MTFRVFVVVFPVVLAIGLNPVLAGADDSARISRLESEIQLLRTRIDEQQRQIARLQEELNRRSSEPVIGTIQGKREDRVAAVATERLPWHSPESWARITKGMTEEQVTQILGPPGSLESFGRYKTLFYRGSVSGSGTLSGHVNMLDDRVLAVGTPAFGDP